MEKDRILEEIRRTAAENGGKPLGTRRFADRTGIREIEWLGKYWPRWGDALREAGFEPNTLQRPYDDDFLLERYVEVVRELAHPVKAELQMTRHRDPTFPDVNVFIRRFGGLRKAAIPRIIDYCQRSQKHSDVLTICLAWQDAQPSHVDKEASGDKPIIVGYVYLLRSGRHYKIGRTNAVGRRERELAIQLPQKGQVIHQIATDDPAGIEAYWHRRFEANRGNGEWFNLSADDVAAFRRRRSM